MGAAADQHRDRRLSRGSVHPVSLITGPEWERAVARYLAGLPGWSAEKRQPPGNHAGQGARFSAAGPADFSLRAGAVRVAVEVKAHTDTAHKRWPLAKLKASQAEDLDAADHGVVLLRFAGHDPDLTRSAEVPDLVAALDWSLLGPLWWTATRTGAGRGLSPRDCFDLALRRSADCVSIVQDPHGSYTCPDILPGLFAAWRHT